MPTIEKISIALPKRNLHQQGLKELQRVWKQAMKDKSPGVAPTEVLSRLEKKYQTMSK